MYPFENFAHTGERKIACQGCRKVLTHFAKSTHTQRMDRNAPIGLFDSGVGGLTVLSALRRALSHESFVYVGDTARVPYGNKSPTTVIRYSQEIVRWLQQQSIKMLVVACNTSSAVALPALQAQCAFPVVGLIPAGAASAVAASPTGRIGVIGTAGTIASGAYPRAIRALRPDAHVIAQACPLLVPLVEEGWIDDAITDDVVRRYLAPLLAEHVDDVILGCTHYPLLTATMRRVVGDRVQLIDPGAATAAVVAEQLTACQLTAPSSATGGVQLFVTDRVAAFSTVAQIVFGAEAPLVTQIAVQV